MADSSPLILSTRESGLVAGVARARPDAVSVSSCGNGRNLRDRGPRRGTP